ncbi:MAG: anti-sigma factor domain-containing protein [Kineosporiaceae bacterium]
MAADERPAGAGSRDEFVTALTARLDSAAERALGDAGPEDLADAVVGELRSARAWEAPPMGLRDAVMARVLAEAGNVLAADSPAPDSAAASSPAPESPAAQSPAPGVSSLDAHRSARAERSGRRPRLVWAVPAAAAAAAVFAVGVLAADRYVSTLRLGAETYRASGTELAPDAEAEVSIVETGSGFAIVFDPQDLPAAAEGSYYAAWLRAADGVSVPIGSFHGRQDERPIELWSGVDPAEFEALTVTLQSVGAPVLPSGPPVMRAELR